MRNVRGIPKPNLNSSFHELNSIVASQPLVFLSLSPFILFSQVQTSHVPRFAKNLLDKKRSGAPEEAQPEFFSEVFCTALLSPRNRKSWYAAHCYARHDAPSAAFFQPSLQTFHRQISVRFSSLLVDSRSIEKDRRTIL